MFRKNPPVSDQHHKHLYKAFENFRRVELEEFRHYLRSPLRIFWANFLAGTARGLGLLFGATVIIALTGFILKEWLAHIPVVGQFFMAVDTWIETTIRGPRL